MKEHPDKNNTCKLDNPLILVGREEVKRFPDIFKEVNEVAVTILAGRELVSLFRSI